MITVGTNEIGLATAKEFVAQGAKVIITGRKKEDVEKIAVDLNVTGIVSNQSKLTKIDNLVSQAKSIFGRPDILFINAGIVLFSSIAGATGQ